MRHRTRRDNHFKLIFTALIVLFVAFSLSWHRTTPAFAQQIPAYRLIGPDLAAQGEGEITGIVVEETNKGEVPLSEGDEVVIRGAVVHVGPGGKIKLPTLFKEAGNQFLVLEITRLVGGVPAKPATISQHIEVVPMAQGVPTVVDHASEICTPVQPLRVTGQALDKLQKAILKGQDGTEHQLGDSVGSSLQRIYLGPKDLPKGTYRFAAQDASGQRYEAPNQSRVPSLKIEGTQIRQRGDRGHFTITSDVEGDVLLSGGEPQIQLDTRAVHVTPRSPGRVDFTALVVGNYEVSSRLLNREDVPPDPRAPRVDANPGPIQTRYDPNRNETHVSCPMSVVDQNGKPVANAPVDVAVAHPNGVQYQRLNTDKGGRASFSHTFPGQLAAGALAMHAYRVLGRAWNKQPPLPPPKSGPLGEGGPESRPKPPGPGPAGAAPAPAPTPAPSPSTCGPGPPPTTYTVKHLSTLGLSPSAHCIATGVNFAGKVAGACSPSYFGSSGPGAWHAFLTDAGDAIKPKDDLSLKPSMGFPAGVLGGASMAMGVNFDGHVVGWVVAAGSGDYKAFWYDGSTMNNLHPSMAPFKISKAYAVNKLDDVVGEAWSSLADKHAVIWPHGTHAMTDLNELLPIAAKKDWKLLQAYAINDDGHIVGRAIHLGKVHAFLLKVLGGVPIDLGALAEYKDDSSAAYSLNACDDVVGYTHVLKGFHGFHLADGAGMTDIGTLPVGKLLDPSDSYGQAINKKDEVVGAVSISVHQSVIFEGITCLGTCYTMGDSGVLYSHAIWYSAGKLKDLNDLIPDSPGWELEYANGINDKGQIAGSGFYKAGFHKGVSLYSKAVLLMPAGFTPTPATGSTSLAASSTSKGYIFDNWNTSGVKNSPAKDTVFTLDADYFITFIADYHWNDGKGAVPGMKGISLKDSHGTVFGPWAVTASSGQGGAPNVNWECHPGVVIPAGTYTVVDPDPATWSQNDASGNSGFTRVAGYPAKK